MICSEMWMATDHLAEPLFETSAHVHFQALVQSVQCKPLWTGQMTEFDATLTQHKARTQFWLKTHEIVVFMVPVTTLQFGKYAYIYFILSKSWKESEKRKTHVFALSRAIRQIV